MTKTMDVFAPKTELQTIEVITEASPFSRALKAARVACDKSQTALAKEIGIERTSIIHYEKGRYLPPLDVFVKLCKALNTTPNDLLGF